MYNKCHALVSERIRVRLVFSLDNLNFGEVTHFRLTPPLEQVLMCEDNSPLIADNAAKMGYQATHPSIYNLIHGDMKNASFKYIITPSVEHPD